MNLLSSFDAQIYHTMIGQCQYIRSGFTGTLLCPRAFMRPSRTARQGIGQDTAALTAQEKNWKWWKNRRKKKRMGDEAYKMTDATTLRGVGHPISRTRNREQDRTTDLSAAGSTAAGGQGD